VPAGEAFGLPVGLSFIGTAWSEPRLIALAYAYEQATKHRHPPAFVSGVTAQEPSPVRDWIAGHLTVDVPAGGARVSATDREAAQR
jgi:hypothetical protein